MPVSWIRYLSPGAFSESLHGKVTVNLVLRGCAVLFAFLMHLTIARLLGAHQSGLIFLAWSLLFMAAVIAKQGLDAALIRYAGSAWDKADYGALHSLLTSALSQSMSASIRVSIFLLIVSYPLAMYVFQQPELLSVLIFIGLSVIPYSQCWVYSGFLKAISRAHFATTVESLLIPVSMLLQISILYFINMLNANNVAIAFLISCTATMLVSYVIVKKCFPCKSVKNKKFPRNEMMKSAKQLMMVDGMNWLIAFSAIPILGIFASAEEVAQYSVAQKLAVQVSMVLLVCNSIVAPRFSGLYESGRNDEIWILMRKIILLMTFISLPLAMIFIFWPSIISLLFGEEFFLAESLLPLLAFAQLINVMTGPAGYLLTTTGHERIMKNIMLINVVLIVPLVFVCSWQWHAPGAVFATSLGVIAQNLSALFYARNKIETSKRETLIPLNYSTVKSRIS